MELTHPKNSYVNVGDTERLLSIAAGVAIAGVSLRKGRWAVPGLLVASAMLHRGLTGRCQTKRALGVYGTGDNAPLPYELGIKVRAGVTIDKPRQHVYGFWRRLENLPAFMRHLSEVRQRDDKHSRWTAIGPMNRLVTWEAEIINEIPGELIGWKSLPDSDVDNAGSVRFQDAPGGRGTEVRVTLQYNPPAGVVGAYVAKLLGREPEQEIRADLGRLKQIMECGEVATVENQTHGGKSRRAQLGEKKRGLTRLTEVIP